MAVIISAIVVGITSANVYFFYITTYRIVHHQMAKRLKNIAHIDSLLFDEIARERIK